MSLLLFFTGTGVATPVPPGPPPPAPPVVISTGAGAYGTPSRLTQPLSRAEWQRLLRGDGQTWEEMERERLLKLMLEDDDLMALMLL